MDLIERQAAIDELHKCQTYLFDSKDHDMKISLEDAEYAIQILPSAEPEWIPVSKKYPTPWELVWVTDKLGRVNVCQMSHKDNQYWYDGEEEWMYEHDAIVAWMPYYVPEPYEEIK